MQTPDELRVVPQRYEADVPIDRLVSFEGNPKLHDRERIAESISFNGWAGVIYAEEGTGRILAGHGRVEDLLERGAGSVPGVVWLETEDEDHARRLLVALNPHPDDPGYDAEKLAAILTDLAEQSPEGLDGSTFSGTELDLLLADLSQDPDLGPTDPNEEWVGMPEFEQEDKKSAYQTTIHFASKEDAERFYREVFDDDQARRSAWWPAHDGFEGSSFREQYVAADGEAEPGA